MYIVYMYKYENLYTNVNISVYVSKYDDEKRIGKN
jgi:hypothetical protein